MSIKSYTKTAPPVGCAPKYSAKIDINPKMGIKNPPIITTGGKPNYEKNTYL